MTGSIAERNPRACRACDNVRGNKEVRTGVYTCAKCEAIFGTCYLGDSYAYVLPRMAEGEPKQPLRYFDFTTLGSAGVGRRHGWYDPATRLIHQIG